jgi:hypothetical protein
MIINQSTDIPKEANQVIVNLDSEDVFVCIYYCLDYTLNIMPSQYATDQVRQLLNEMKSLHKFNGLLSVTLNKDEIDAIAHCLYHTSRIDIGYKPKRLAELFRRFKMINDTMKVVGFGEIDPSYCDQCYRYIGKQICFNCNVHFTRNSI